MGFSRWAAMALILISPFANAFTLELNSGLKGWDFDELVVAVNYNSGTCAVDQATLQSAIESAFDAINSIPGIGIQLALGASSSVDAATAAALTSTDNPIIICDPDFATTLGLSPAQVDGLVANTIFASSSGTRLDYSVMLLNSLSTATANIGNISTFQLEYTITHELGHMLGVGHSNDSKSLMYYDLAGKEHVRFSQDDIDAFNYLYPRGEPFDRTAFGCGMVEGGGGSSGGPGRFALFVGLLALIVLVVKKSRLNIGSLNHEPICTSTGNNL